MTSEPVVGLDLADKLGISVIDRKTEKLLFSASISLARGDTQKRLLRLRECLIEVFTRFSPVEVAIEDVFLPAKTSRARSLLVNFAEWRDSALRRGIFRYFITRPGK